MSRQRPGLGIALIVLMAACFAALDNSIKYLGALMPLMFLLWWRYAFQAVAMGTWLFIDALRRPSTANGTSAGASTWLATASGTPDLDMAAGRLPSRWIAFHTAHPRFQALRGLLLLTTSALSFMGLRYMPVAEFTAINMLTPVGVTLLAGWVLHEHVSRLRWVLVMGACVGALIVIRPGSGLFGWAVFFPMAGALTYASFQVLTRRLAALESPYTTHFYTGLTGMLAMTPLLWFVASDTASALRAASTGEIALVFEQFDTVIFNASFHYSENYAVTLREAFRCVRSGGMVIISDTPWYSHEESGRQMISERRATFSRCYGTASDSINSLEYLTNERLHILEEQLSIRWTIHSPRYGFKWTMRPIVAKLRQRREPSQFRIYVARKNV